LNQQARETVTLKLTAMAHGGDALGRDQAGRVIFVPYALAGETVSVELIEAKKGFARGRVVDLLEPSPQRVEPRCPHFGPWWLGPAKEGFVKGCGGCQWQHIAYETQLEFKTQIVREQFARVAKLPQAPVRPMISSRHPWNYRNQMRFAADENGALGLQELESHALVPIRECHIANPPLWELFKMLALEGGGFETVTLRASENLPERLVLFGATDAEPPELETDEAISVAFESGSIVMPLIGKEYLEEEVAGRRYRISPSSFFQTNTTMAETILSLVAEFLAPRPEDTLLDGYAGVGLFGLALADKVSLVVQVEENPYALQDARVNAGPQTNVQFHQGRVEEILPDLDTRLDIAVVDPPRAGMGVAALDALAAHRPRAIAYVSCDPATLARDVRRLVDRGYQLAVVQPVDMFPQTWHVESVSCLVLEPRPASVS
jgi:23S rRNA (uracil1939-C5)-methyltransferase